MSKINFVIFLSRSQLVRDVLADIQRNLLTDWKWINRSALLLRSRKHFDLLLSGKFLDIISLRKSDSYESKWLKYLSDRTIALLKNRAIILADAKMTLFAETLYPYRTIPTSARNQKDENLMSRARLGRTDYINLLATLTYWRWSTMKTWTYLQRYQSVSKSASC